MAGFQAGKVQEKGDGGRKWDANLRMPSCVWLELSGLSLVGPCETVPSYIQKSSSQMEAMEHK